jgi:tetratricopeptide (TPR) repeat protein
VGSLVWTAPAESVTDSNFSAALDLLHDGKFDAAERRTRPAAASGELPDVFLDAFVYYWRLLYDDKNPTLQAAFDTRLTRTISLAQTRLGKDPKDAEAAVLGGTAHILRAQLLGRQKKAMAVAHEAKRGRRVLLQTQDPDALFGLGSYNYSIDQLQGAARSLRAVMGIPGGDREEGLRQLERAAREGKRFGLEARLLLMITYAGKRERQLEAASDQAERLVAEHGDAAVALHAAARTELLMGRTDRAAGWLERALRGPRTPIPPWSLRCAWSARAANWRASAPTAPRSGSSPCWPIPEPCPGDCATRSRRPRPRRAPSPPALPKAALR